MKFRPTPNLRYPLYRWTTFWTLVGVALSAYIVLPMRHNDLVVRKKKYDEFWKFVFFCILMSENS